MRVIAGKYRSRPLKTLRGSKLRPTSDRLRETLFDILAGEVAGSVFVDVYAGTGAVGIEAVSRGAREVFFIESHRAAVHLIGRNLRDLGIVLGAEVITADAVTGLKYLAGRGQRAEIVFLDPPYEHALDYARALQFLDGSRLLEPGGRVIVEHPRKKGPRGPDLDALAATLERLERTRVVEQGSASLSFFAIRNPD